MQVDIGWLMGNIIGVLFVLLTFAYLIWASIHKFSEYDAPKWTWITGGLIALVIQIGISIGFNFPFNMEYHSYRPVTGTVASINSRLVDTGNHSTETKYVITFRGNDQPYGLTDTRGAGIKAGDKIGLKCERTWQYVSVSGYDCRYNSVNI